MRNESRQVPRRQTPVHASGACKRRPARARTHLDFFLIHDVERCTTGASIHAIAQQLQIYVSAMECGEWSRARSIEAQLRAFLIL